VAVHDDAEVTFGLDVTLDGLERARPEPLLGMMVLQPGLM
jgi:hypothetical protein